MPDQEAQQHEGGPADRHRPFPGKARGPRPPRRDRGGSGGFGMRSIGHERVQLELERVFGHDELDLPRRQGGGLGVSGGGEEPRLLAGVTRRPALPHVFHVVRERLRVGIPVGGILGHGPRDHPLRVGGDPPHDPRQGDGVVVHDPPHDLGNAVCGERGLPGDQGVDDRAQREDVGPAVELLLRGLLRRRVEGCAQELSGVRELLEARGVHHPARDAEVHDLRLAGVQQHDVGGFHVAVHDAVLVRVVERARQLGDDAERLAPGAGTPRSRPGPRACGPPGTRAPCRGCRCPRRDPRRGPPRSPGGRAGLPRAPRPRTAPRSRRARPPGPGTRCRWSSARRAAATPGSSARYTIPIVPRPSSRRIS